METTRGMTIEEKDATFDNIRNDGRTVKGWAIVSGFKVPTVYNMFRHEVDHSSKNCIGPAKDILDKLIADGYLERGE